MAACGRMRDGITEQVPQHLSQPVLLNLELESPSEKAFTSDDFADALDYAALVKRLQTLAANHSYKV